EFPLAHRDAIGQLAGLLEDPRLGPHQPREAAVGRVVALLRTGLAGAEQLQGPRPAPGLGPDHRRTCASREAVRSAASAASAPLFPAAPPERASACARSSVVSRPKPIGT